MPDWTSAPPSAQFYVAGNFCKHVGDKEYVWHKPDQKWLNCTKFSLAEHAMSNDFEWRPDIDRKEVGEK